MPQTILEKVQQASLHLLEPLDSETLYRVCVDEAINLSDANCGSLFLAKNGELSRVYSTVPLEHRLTPRPGGNTYKAFLDGKIRCVSAKKIHQVHPEGYEDFKSYIFIPLVYQQQRIGILTLQSLNEVQYTADQEDSFEVFGSIAVLALRNIELYEQTHQALENRELFMSTASHELKTPLTTIHAYAQIIQKKMIQEQKLETHWIEAILANSYRLQTLIQDLFSMSQMKMGVFTYSFKTLNLKESLAQIVKDDGVSFGRKIVFKDDLGDEEPVIKGDPDKLVLAFNNILGNAAKYSSPEKPIVVTLSKKKNHFFITVVDEGIGISEEDLPHVFEQNYQGKHKRAKGMGLGMYLCKQIIETHLGEIHIKSKIGQGTTVEVYFPRTNI